VGGDGTIHEVLNGIMGTEKILGIIPIGSGNDFVKSVAVPARLNDAISVISRQVVRRIDVAKTQVWEHGKDGSTISYFINGVGVGFDAAVAEQTKHIRYATGTLLYLVAVLQTLRKYNSPIYSVEIDGWKNVARNLLIAVGNGVCVGGGFYLTPKAKMDDGLLDICLINEARTIDILKLMPAVMRGNHEGLHGVQFKTGTSISIESSHPISVHADGEMLGNEITRVKIDILPRALNVITG
ncbi:MAG TPA: diacylglycerol kinase, partial [Bacteroidetes bacterium]|nr:diacylglycerol kinase [Bacteroidota bacterium]